MLSVSGKYWFPRRRDEQFVAEIKHSLQVSDLLARIIADRTNTMEAACNFFTPRVKSLLPDPYHLKDMDKAIKRVETAICKQEKICIFADYDVDGATSAAILKKFFMAIGIEVIIYVPDRITEGYGPTSSAMHKIKEQGASLVITVDCGSVAFTAIECATQLSLDVIVIDHHISLDVLPDAVAVINPNRLDEDSQCKELAAVGVVFLFLVGLASKLKDNQLYSKRLPNLMQYLDLVALGTVCDVMPITGLNRAFVYQGLKVAQQRGNIGYSTLCTTAQIDERLNCYHLGFVIGPRINAGGRVGKSDLGAKLLATNSIKEANEISDKLNVLNQERRVIELTMLAEAEHIIQMQNDIPDNQAMIFVASTQWHPGVIGIVASKLKDKYNKPVAVVALNAGIGKASCRSVAGIDFGCRIIEAKYRGLLIEGGGHAMAGGFTVAKDKINDLREFFMQSFAQALLKSDIHMRKYYEFDLTTCAANMVLLEELSVLEPFGHGNQEPIFRFTNLYVLKANIVGNNHIKIMFAPTKDSYSKKVLSAMAFNAVGSKMAEVILSPSTHKVSIMGKLRAQHWQGRQSVQILLQDILIED